MFQLMNEPHDLNMTAWAATNQQVIHAIRAITPVQPILVSGTQFARLTNWDIYSVPALSTLHDPADNLLFDFHQYFDDDGGAYGVCEPWETFAPVFEHITAFLRGGGRRGILTEFGGAPVPSCVGVFEGLLSLLEQNRNVWAGWTVWGPYNAGGSLEMSLDPASPKYTLVKILKAFAPGNRNTGLL